GRNPDVARLLRDLKSLPELASHLQHAGQGIPRVRRCTATRTSRPVPDSYHLTCDNLGLIELAEPDEHTRQRIESIASFAIVRTSYALAAVDHSSCYRECVRRLVLSQQKGDQGISDINERLAVAIGVALVKGECLLNEELSFVQPTQVHEHTGQRVGGI